MNEKEVRKRFHYWYRNMSRQGPEFGNMCSFISWEYGWKAALKYESLPTSTNNARVEIPTFEIMWQRISKGCPNPSSFTDAVAADAARMGAAVMYDALIKIKVGTSPIA